MLGETHPRRIVTADVSYDNELRTHLSLNQDAPIDRPIQRIGRIIPVRILGGLHHQYCRTQFVAGTRVDLGRRLR